MPAKKQQKPFLEASEKLSFRIGEVAEIVGVPRYVLRYWESEFPWVRPQKSSSKQRVYGRKDIENLLKIKHLLYEQKFTIAGAREQLRENLETVDMADPAPRYVLKKSLQKIQQELDELMNFINHSEHADLERDADPAAYVRSMGGGQAIFVRSRLKRGPDHLLRRNRRS